MLKQISSCFDALRVTAGQQLTVMSKREIAKQLIKLLSEIGAASGLDEFVVMGGVGAGPGHPCPGCDNQAQAILLNWKICVMDQLFSTADAALRTLFATPRASRVCPTLALEATDLSASEKAQAGALMRVNHVGEICAQALYTAQAFATQNDALRAHFIKASAEETDHLAWTEQRLQELGAHKSLLNPLWYGAAFGLGLLAGRLGDTLSLGFVVETESQVEAHLESHLSMLPGNDHASRAIVAQMKEDEARHALDARKAGAAELPQIVKTLMTSAAKVMTTVAHRV